MLDYKEQVEAYIKRHFKPDGPDTANVRHTNTSMSRFLFMTFPEDCISDYDLDDIMRRLGYERHQWLEEHQIKRREKKKEFVEIHKEIVTGWCLKSDFNLKPDVFEIDKNTNTRLEE